VAGSGDGVRGPVAVGCRLCSMGLFGCSGRLVALGVGRLCRGSGVEGRDAKQVVGRRGDLEPGPVALAAYVAELAAAADGLDPPEGFLDPFPDPHAGLVAGVAGGPPVDGGALPGVVLGDVRGEAEVAGLGDEPSGVVALVTSDSAAPGPLG